MLELMLPEFGIKFDNDNEENVSGLYNDYVVDVVIFMKEIKESRCCQNIFILVLVSFQ
ncbi:hypothetical protein HanRHA438_Chr16g0740111 [Helianthus annuus]|nr:hypothetical protein HanRHA438_Chr16g0740111 [Helianthus annuus]